MMQGFADDDLKIFLNFMFAYIISISFISNSFFYFPSIDKMFLSKKLRIIFASPVSAIDGKDILWASSIYDSYLQ